MTKRDLLKGFLAAGVQGQLSGTYTGPCEITSISNPDGPPYGPSCGKKVGDVVLANITFGSTVLWTDCKGSTYPQGTYSYQTTVSDPCFDTIEGGSQSWPSGPFTFGQACNNYENPIKVGKCLAGCYTDASTYIGAVDDGDSLNTDELSVNAELLVGGRLNATISYNCGGRGGGCGNYECIMDGVKR
jgi:hypothetical protein